MRIEITDDNKELAREWLVREDIVDHSGPYRLRLIAAGTTDEIIRSLERVLHELQSSAPNFNGLNAGGALCDWDVTSQVPLDEAA